MALKRSSVRFRLAPPRLPRSPRLAQARAGRDATSPEFENVDEDRVSLALAETRLRSLDREDGRGQEVLTSSPPARTRAPTLIRSPADPFGMRISASLMRRAGS